jgi:predicted AlkP superfamily phosphohydrolase/phosphomutase
MRRVAAIGLDAAEWTYMEPLLADGTLPNLAAIQQRSLQCRLDNPVAHRWGILFQQFLYGHEATLTARWDPMGFDPTTYDTIQLNASLLSDETRFYEADANLRSIAFDVPALGLSDNPKAVQVIGWGASAPYYPRAAHPAGLLREIDRTFGPHPGCNNEYDVGWHEPDKMDLLVAGLCEGALRRSDIAHMLQQRFGDWEFFLTVMSEAHSGGEYLWHGTDPSHPVCSVVDGQAAGSHLRTIYSTIDEAVGRFADRLPADTVLVVFALDGCRTSPGDTVSLALLPELLHRLHFGKALITDADASDWRAAGCPPVVPAPGQTWRDCMDARWIGADAPSSGRQGSRVDQIRRAWRLRRCLPRVVADRMARPYTGALGIEIRPETHLTRRDIADRRGLPTDYLFTGRYRPWWNQMRAFALPSYSDGLVRINLRGREASGLVDLADYDSVCTEVESAVMACRNPRTGRPAVSEVLRLRPDPLDPEGAYADLAVLWAEPVDALDHPDVGLIGPMPFHRTATHTGNGFAFISGPGITPGDLGSRSALDLPPTLLALLGRSTAGFAGESLVGSLAVD